MTPLSSDERRALGLLAALVLLAGAARWLERPRSILDDVPEVDVAALEDASRAAKSDRARATQPRQTRASSASTRNATATSPTTVRSRPAADAPPTAAARSEPEPLDLNAASAQQLERISGVGPALAARLIARRDSLGRFRNFDDVDSVRGVGPALLARIRAAAVLR